MFVISNVHSQNYEPDSIGKAWFPDAKFGIFVHWVIDYFPKNNLSDVSTNYPKYWKEANVASSKFTASNYNPVIWAKQFKSCGAKYVVLTTKHHVGFALYDYKGANFTAKNNSPAKRDLLTDYVKAMRNEGLKVGFYFSLPDWMHPDYLTLKTSNNGKEVDWQKSDFVRWKKFTDEMLAEIRHLCTAYGKIDLFWFDGDWERSAEMWRSKEIADTIYKYQPHAVINNRLRSSEIGDYSTPEMIVPLKAPDKGWTELCTTLGYNWAGTDSEKDLKNPSELVRIFGDMLTIGGNTLLNVSPDQTGEISSNQFEKINLLGNWIRLNSEAVYGSRAGLPWGLFNGGSTRKGSTIYLIAYETSPNELVVKGIEGEIERITHLSTGTELKFRTMSDYHSDNGRKGWRFITLPKELIEPFGTVLKITFKNKKVSIKSPEGDTINWEN